MTRLRSVFAHFLSRIVFVLFSAAAMAPPRFVRLRKWHNSAKGGKKFLAVRLHAFKKTHQVRHNFSVCWVWKREGVALAFKDLPLRPKPKPERGGVREDLALRNPLTRKSCTLHRTACCLKFGVRDSICGFLRWAQTFILKLESWVSCLFLFEASQAVGMQTTTTAGLGGCCWIGASYGGGRGKTQTRSTPQPLEREPRERQV